MTADQLLALRNIDKILKLISTNRSNRKDYNIHIQDICHNMVKCITQYKKELTNRQKIFLNKIHRDLIARDGYESADQWFADQRKAIGGLDI